MALRQRIEVLLFPMIQNKYAPDYDGVDDLLGAQLMLVSPNRFLESIKIMPVRLIIL